MLSFQVGTLRCIFSAAKDKTCRISTLVLLTQKDGLSAHVFTIDIKLLFSDGNLNRVQLQRQSILIRDFVDWGRHPAENTSATPWSIPPERSARAGCCRWANPTFESVFAARRKPPPRQICLRKNSPARPCRTGAACETGTPVRDRPDRNGLLPGHADKEFESLAAAGWLSYKCRHRSSFCSAFRTPLPSRPRVWEPKKIAPDGMFPV